MSTKKWPKKFAPLTQQQEKISNDFMQYWHEHLAGDKQYSFIEKFNHGYPIKKSNNFKTTLEIGAGLGEHLNYEKLNDTQKRNYTALELRQNMADQLKNYHPEINVQVGDCQEKSSFIDEHFDRIIAIHVLEHLPNLPAAIQEIYRLCNKTSGQFLVVIPCEGGFAYSLARKISAERLFKKRYKMPYKWFIEREHVNTPAEIIEELNHYFEIVNCEYYPFKYLPFVFCNLVMGLSLKPKLKLNFNN